MRGPETPYGERSSSSLYASALWVFARTLAVTAGLCWVGLNVAVYTRYMQTGDLLSLFTLDPRHGGSSSSSGSQQSVKDTRRSVAISSTPCTATSAGVHCDNGGEAGRKDPPGFLLPSRTDTPESPAVGSTQATASEPPVYVAVGEVKPNEYGEYGGAQPDRMHGYLGRYPDGTSAYVTGPPPPPSIPVQELLARGGGFNILLSDHLPLDREPADSRTSSCKHQQYDGSKLPKASVIIIFYNEPFSTLFRSVHSVLNLTPPQLLEEIVLVDDGSTLDYIRGSPHNSEATGAGQRGSVEKQNFATADKFFLDIATFADDDGGDEEGEDRGQTAPLRKRGRQFRPLRVPGSINYRISPSLVEYLRLLPDKVKLLRNKDRKGIVGARMCGIRAAKAPIFIILDSHIEVQPHWIEPLLARIAGDRRRIVMPQIDGIEADTLEYVGGGIGCKLGFLWKLMEHSYEPHQLARFATGSTAAVSTEPPVSGHIRGGAAAKEEEAAAKAPGESFSDTAGESAETSPVMAGGLFAADKQWFFQIGAYDEDFQYWGTENLELSFRLWQCGGVLECAPCSRVYHMFRKGGAGYGLPPHAVTVNKMRTMIWMDQYADLAWRVLGKPRVDFGRESLQQRKQWRIKNGCKSFEWFMHNVFPEGDVLDLRDVPYLGPLKNKGAHACLTADGFPSPGSKVSLRTCWGSENQDFMYFRTVGHIMPVRDDEACLEISGRLDWCRAQPQHEWKLTAKGLLVNQQTQKCLSGFSNAIRAVDCDDTDSFQVWSWTEYNPPEVFEFPPPADQRRP